MQPRVEVSKVQPMEAVSAVEMQWYQNMQFKPTFEWQANSKRSRRRNLIKLHATVVTNTRRFLQFPCYCSVQLYLFFFLPFNFPVSSLFFTFSTWSLPILERERGEKQEYKGFWLDTVFEQEKTLISSLWKTVDLQLSRA